ncbi:MAG: hypothetical protein KGR68_09185 [Betaproteobacteria bacterium]|nr:hypothetical protein [Betaproteobacteria bacterium]
MTTTAERLLLALTRVSTARQVCRSAEAEQLLAVAMEDMRAVLAVVERDDVPGTEYRG